MLWQSSNLLLQKVMPPNWLSEKWVSIDTGWSYNGISGFYLFITRCVIVICRFSGTIGCPKGTWRCWNGSRCSRDSCECLNTDCACETASKWSSTSFDEYWSFIKRRSKHFSSFKPAGKASNDLFWNWLCYGSVINNLVFLQGEDDFYIRYYTLQLLTALLTNSPIRYVSSTTF